MNYKENIDKLLNRCFTMNSVQNNDERFNAYINSIMYLNKNNILKLDYESILNIINNSILKNEYLNILATFKYELLINSDVHGIDHVVRTSFYALIISIVEKLDIQEFRIVLECILYHDIGRVNDTDDDLHGYNSSLKINFLKEKYSEEDLKYIKALMTGHSLDDYKYIELANKYSLKDIIKYKKLLNIVKDADALDRVREYPYTDIKYLRTDISKSLICFAYELFVSYQVNKYSR